MLADNGQTIVLGGLVSDDYLETKRQVPIVGDLPIVGELFKSRRETRNKRTLFIFLKPTILRNPEDAAAVAKSKYCAAALGRDRQQPAQQPAAASPGAAADGGDRRDLLRANP
ncbi:MAG: hypothetical protein WDN24_14555 [Sphingomonas sp.]